MALTQVQPAMLGTPQPNNFKNRIINGAMAINQRAYSATPSASEYTLDRWLANLTTASKFSVAQSTVAPAGFVNSVLLTSTSAYSVASGDYNTFQQRIEANNMQDAGWGTSGAQTFTLSFWVRSSLTGTFGGSLYFPASTARTYPFSYTISAANTWEKKYITIVGDTTTNTAPTGTSLYVIVQWALGVGSTYSGTAGSWVSGNYASVTGATNLVATNGATMYLTGTQFELGSTATDFDYRPYGTELFLCQRYFNILNGTNYNSIGVGISTSTTAAGIHVSYPVQMRVTPSVASSGSLIITDRASYDQTVTALNAYNGSPTSVYLALSNASGTSAFRTALLTVSNGGTGNLVLSAEL